MIIFIRHGETDYNAKNLWMGRTDILLNKRGLLQAKTASTLLQGFNFSKIYTSPLKRALQTASIIHKQQPNQPNLIIDKLLQERSFGELEGLRKTQDIKNKLHLNQSAEPLEHLKSRLLSFIKKIDTNERVLIVSHSAVFRCLTENLELTTKPNTSKLKNCEFVELELPI